MLIETRAVAPFFKNGYVVACEETRDGVIVDPGEELDDLLAVIGANHISIRHILLTHAHVDHVSGVARARERFGAPIHLHRDDLPVYAAAVQQGLFFGWAIEAPPPVDHYYDQLPIVFGRHQVRAHHTPGHTPGGVCLEVGDAGGIGPQLFTGDTLFNGSIGRTDLPGGDYPSLIESIKRVLFAFPDDTAILPGHGPKSTIGEERRTNPFLR
jgi:glyoxylase-like metal-dependent hydrolase (beta-lactamase superfamily II)